MDDLTQPQGAAPGALPATPATLRPIVVQNPFTPGVVVPPERFIGRAHDLIAIQSRLENMLSVSIVGDARIGKSSLLHYLTTRLPTLLAARGRYLAIYLSMDGQTGQASFCRQILGQLLPEILLPSQEVALRALEQRLEHEPAPAMADLARALAWAKESGLHVILLLDEFKDLLARPEEFDAAFRGELRNWYTFRTVALVTAARQSLTEIADLRAYFVNGIVEQRLGLLTEAEAELLLRQPHDRPFTDAEVRLGLDVGQRHPLRLQAAGFQLYQSKGSVPGDLHTLQGALGEAAPARLRRRVQVEFDQAQQASRTLQRPAPWRWLDALGRAAIRSGEAAETAQARVLGAFMLLGLLVVGGLLAACALGAISLAQLGELLRAIVG